MNSSFRKRRLYPFRYKRKNKTVNNNTFNNKKWNEFHSVIYRIINFIVNYKRSNLFDNRIFTPINNYLDSNSFGKTYNLNIVSTDPNFYGMLVEYYFIASQIKNLLDEFLNEPEIEEKKNYRKPIYDDNYDIECEKKQTRKFTRKQIKDYDYFNNGSHCKRKTKEERCKRRKKLNRNKERDFKEISNFSSLIINKGDKVVNTKFITRELRCIHCYNPNDFFVHDYDFCEVKCSCCNCHYYYLHQYY